MSLNKNESLLPAACGYVCFFNGKRFETLADSLYAAKLLAVAHFKPAKSKQHMVSVTLAEVCGGAVAHTPDF